MKNHQKSHRIPAQFRPLIALSCLALASGSASAATLEQVPDIPTVEVILARGDEAPLGNAGSQATFGFRNADADGTEGTRGRGQSFVINPSAPGSTFEISNLAVALAGGGGTGIRPDGNLTLTVFEFASSATGGAAAEADDAGAGNSEADPPIPGSDWQTSPGVGAQSGTILFTESFPIAAGTDFSDSNLLNIAFDAGELQLDSDTAYAFFFLYTLDDVTGLGADVTIAFDADNNAPDNAPGALLNTNPSTDGFASAPNGSSVSRDLNYFITGRIAGAPSSPSITTSATLVNVSNNAIILDITFDPSVTTAELDTPTGLVDLVALDDGTNGDLVANDGIVSYSDSPSASHLYVVTTTSASFPDDDASVLVNVADPSLEAPDNAFSTAIKADSPLFYYRFEEAAETGFLLDSSGNSHHTDQLIGNITLGAAPGGMQNAASFAAGSGILVPATSAMDSAFTLSMVLNEPNFSNSGLQNVFSMTDGTSIGRSIFFHNNSGFISFIDGVNTFLTTPVALPDATSCLVHATFDPDPDNDPSTVNGEMRVFLNGIEIGSAPIDNIFDGSTNPVDNNIANWVLGSNKNLGTASYTGFLDETAVFETELTDSQIAAHAAAFFTAGDPFLGFYSDSTEITEGDSVELSWKVSDSATGVTINGNPVDGAAGGGVYSDTFAPTTTTTYLIEVTGPGGPFTFETEVVVLAPPGPLVITNCTFDDATPPNITIEFMGDPDTEYQIVASAVLNFDPGELITNVTTNGSGVGTAAFIGDGASEFYRVQLP